MDKKIYRVYSPNRNNGGYYASMCTFDSFMEAKAFVGGRNLLIEEEDAHPRYQDY